MHILKDQIHLRHRPWHFKLRFNIADHMVARYNAGEPTAFPQPAGTACWSIVQTFCGRVWVHTICVVPHVLRLVHAYG